MGIPKSEPCGLPPAFLLELSAVLELRLWELQGLRSYLDADLPTSREAAHALANRAKKGPAEFEGPDAAPLSVRVLHVWMEAFAFDGPDFLHADLIVRDVDEDAFIDVLSEFVWRHRHDISMLLNR
jgi:hypothetical protein